MNKNKAKILIEKYKIPTTVNLNYSYPVKPRRYREYVGDILPDAVKFVLEGKGYTVRLNRAFVNGVDLKTFHENNLIMVGEIFNLWKHSHINSLRAQGYIRNLCQYDCKRIIICSLTETFESRWFRDLDIISLGYQLLPETFYRFFEKKGETDDRKMLTSDTLQHIDSLITEYLENNNLLAYNYIHY